MGIRGRFCAQCDLSSESFGCCADQKPSCMTAIFILTEPHHSSVHIVTYTEKYRRCSDLI